MEVYAIYRHDAVDNVPLRKVIEAVVKVGLQITI
jgi:hypothetical protein